MDLRFDAAAAELPVSPTLFGLFFEDINFGCDGGLNANLVINHSFEGVYVDGGRTKELQVMVTRRKPRRVIDHTRYWQVVGGTLTSGDTDAVHSGAHFGCVDVGDSATLTNPGYPGEEASIPIRMEHAYRFKALLRADRFEGAVDVRLADERDVVLASARLPRITPAWHEVEATLQPSGAGRSSLQLVFTGRGRVHVDEVQLVPDDHWGAGDPRWSQGLLRRDLVEALRDLNPTFMRFPGGCIVEGCGDGNGYDWKGSIGPLERRRHDYNLWGLRRPDGGYSQSNQVGFYEYFLLCEDLGMHAMPVVNAGLACQMRVSERVAVDSTAFDQIVQDTIDLIDWATADPDGNEWAALRAAAGHPEPFDLRYLGIGNENFGPKYLERFERIKAAVDGHQPGITSVLSAGVMPQGRAFERSWRYAREHAPEVIVDEHFYRKPSWFTDTGVARYDGYPRRGPKVFVGEYAASTPVMLPWQRPASPNRYDSALAEAAFLTGIERNADVVAMTSYAPLLNRVAHGQWHHNLIDFNATDVLKTANYFVQQLFASDVGHRIVPMTGDLPAGVHASSTTTDERQSVKLVNTTPDVVAVTLEVPAAADQAARATTLRADLRARNELPADGRPRYEVVPVSSTIDVRAGIVELELAPHSILALQVVRRVDPPSI